MSESQEQSWDGVHMGPQLALVARNAISARLESLEDKRDEVPALVEASLDTVIYNHTEAIRMIEMDLYGSGFLERDDLEQHEPPREDDE